MDALLFPDLRSRFNIFENEYPLIKPARKELLEQVAAFVKGRMLVNQIADLNFICTHNSRRSHLSHLWATAASHFYEVEKVRCYSGGTEATAFNVRAVNAMIRAGFKMVKASESQNPRYLVSFGEGLPTQLVFSKKYNDPFNPSDGFAAVMTCSHADENCPVVTGAAVRISLPYEDPKDFDDTPQEVEKYEERVHEIGREMAFAFSRIVH